MASSRQWQQHSGTLLDRVNEFDVIDCTSCGYKHVVPIPTQDELEHVYREDYYSNEKPLYLEEHQEDLEWVLAPDIFFFGESLVDGRLWELSLLHERRLTARGWA